jgi:hypothetical protein
MEDCDDMTAASADPASAESTPSGVSDDGQGATDMTDTDELAADYTALEASTGAVVLARRRLRATRRARLLRRAGKADVAVAKRSLAAARAELNACRDGAGWWVRRPKRRARRLATTAGNTGMLRSRGPATMTVVRAVTVAYLSSMAVLLLVAQWPMRGPRLLGPAGYAAHAGDLLVLAATAIAAVAVLKPKS